MGDVRPFLRYARRLRGFLRRPLAAHQAEDMVASALARREETFLRVLARGIYSRPNSPYKALLDHAGMERGDVIALVEARGLEGALESLYDAGVRVSLDELNGRCPIVRDTLELTASVRDFDNPLAPGDFVGRGGGSRSAPRRVAIDLDLLEHEAALDALFLRGARLERPACGLWRAPPPGLAGVKNALRLAKLDLPIDAWFSPTRVRAVRDAAFTTYTRLAARAAGHRIAAPEFVPLDRPDPALRWLERCRAAGMAVLLDTTASVGVRLSLAASDHEMDLSGVTMRLGGEPFTAAREEVVRATGARAFCHYSLSEVGRVGVACTAPAASDDAHLAEGKLAAVVRNGMLTLSTLHPASPKLLLNVETGDRVTLEERDCGCPLGALGLRRHVHTIRGVEKITSEGLAIGPAEVLRIVDEILPARFGGAPSDFQLVEDQSRALPAVSVVVSPRVADASDEAVVETVLEALADGAAHRRMAAGMWRDAGTVSVVRGEPAATVVGKVLPVHVPSRA